MTHTRRMFVKNGVAVATGISLTSNFIPVSSLFAESGRSSFEPPPIDDPHIKELIQRALDAATAAKAGYAEVRFSHFFRRGVDWKYVGSLETIGVSVRALVDGYWGFAAGPIWTADEMVRLAQAATAQAYSSASAAGILREMILVDRPVVRDQHWTTPFEIDPFSIHPSYISDHLNRAIHYHVRSRPFGLRGRFTVGFDRQEKAYGATDGMYVTQRLITSGGLLGVVLHLDGREVGGSSDIFSPRGGGYEIFDEVKLRQEADRLVEDIQFDYSLPTIPVDIGRFDTLLSAQSAASLLSRTIGDSTQLDRALGFEANASGTTYLDDPSEMLGKHAVTSALINVTGDRSSPGGAATVAWDDDGVKPEPFPIITNGILTNYQTSREMVGLTKDAYQKNNMALVSNGCAQGTNAIDPPIIHTPNLTLHPSQTDNTVESLYKSMKEGVMIGGASKSSGIALTMDQQVLNGYIDGDLSFLYQIKNGQRVAKISGAAILFRSPELWKNVTAIGGQSSVVAQQTVEVRKGQPPQTTHHSVAAVPILFGKLTYIDKKRKA